MKQVIDGVFVFTRTFINAYIVEHSDGLLWIDTGTTPAYINGAIKELKALGYSLEDVRQILITHAHPDHNGGLAYLQTMTNAPTYAHHFESLVIRGEIRTPFASPESLNAFWRFVRNRLASTPPTAPARADYILKEGDAMPDGWQVLELPGHSPGQIGLWHSDKRALIAGDVMMRMPWGLVLPLRPVTPDMDEAKRSVKRVAELNVNTLCLGHGTPIRTGAAPIIEAFAGKFKPHAS